ncbi:MAG: hypothetical protein ACRDPY_38710 [Streptosporangiaceae bacterium]
MTVALITEADANPGEAEYLASLAARARCHGIYYMVLLSSATGAGKDLSRGCAWKPSLTL